MEWPDVAERITAGEDRHTELKRGLGDLKDIARAVCAFANSEGGVVILGVDDARTVVGVKEDAETVQERLTDPLQTGCSAPVSARCARHQDAGGWVHWIEVPRQRGYEPLRCHGRVWVRRERSSVEPSPSELQELYKRVRLHPHGRARHSGGLLRRRRPGGLSSVPARPRIGDQRGTAAHLGRRPAQPRRPDGDRRDPTLYGALAFGKEPQRSPQTASFWVECAAYAGTDRASDVLLVGEGRGRLDEQVQRAAGWVRGLGRFETYSGLARADRPLVPDRALREALVNAVAHRDYAVTGSKVLLEVFSDRIDVTSPGLLPNHMTVESVLAGGHPRSRNELMANYLLVTGLMEQRGRGWPVMRRAMREFNGTDAELLQDAGGKFVRVTLRLQGRS